MSRPTAYVDLPEALYALVPELETLGGSRHRTYVVTATRLVGPEWEVAIAPL